MGFDEINLNLGCPSGTVTSKRRGSGLLAYPQELDRFLDGIFSGADMANGIRYVPEYTNAVLSCEVIESFDLDTQMLFIANVVEAKVLSNGPSCTYAYYHAHIKPKKAPNADQPEGWVCTVCGYFYEGHELPKDFTCPLCKHGPDAFQYVPAVIHEILQAGLQEI